MQNSIRSKTRRAGAAFLVLLTACAVGRSPSVLSPEWQRGAEMLKGQHGDVYFRDPELASAAARVVDSLDRMLPRVSARLGIEREGAPVVRLDSNWPHQANTANNLILFNPSGGMIEYSDLVMAHELVHWTTWDTTLARNLPHTVWEGLCDVIAIQLAPEFADERRVEFQRNLEAAGQLGKLQDVRAQLGLGISDWLALPIEQQDELYALGFALVQRIGVEHLCWAARLERLSPERVLSMAGVRGGPDAEAALLALVRPAALELVFHGASPPAPEPVRFEGHASGQVPPGATSLEVAPVEPGG